MIARKDEKAKFRKGQIVRNMNYPGSKFKVVGKNWSVDGTLRYDLARLSPFSKFFTVVHSGVRQKDIYK